MHPSKIAPFVLDGDAQSCESSHGPRNAFGFSEFAKLAGPLGEGRRKERKLCDVRNRAAPEHSPIRVAFAVG